MKLEELERQHKLHDNGRVIPFTPPSRTTPKLLGPAPEVIASGEGGRHLVCVENDEGFMEYMWLMQDGSLIKADQLHNRGGHLGGVED